MDKMNLSERIAATSGRMREALLRHPVELVILLHAFVAASKWGTEWWQMPAMWWAFAVVAALSLSLYRKRQRWVSWAYWALLPLYALCGFITWHTSHETEFAILCCLLPAAYLLARNQRQGRDFNARVFSLARSVAVAVGIGIVCVILLEIIKYTIETLFNTRVVADEVLLSFSFVLLAPLVFIAMEESKAELKASRLEDALVNYVLTPALIVYHIVLMAYTILIVVRWDLPKGSVASMVSSFMVAAVAIRWLRPMMGKQPLKWYFRWFGLLVLPLVALFWVAASYRIGQYGLTIDRCLLLAMGVMMTMWVVVVSPLPFFKHSDEIGGYWYLALYTACGLMLAVGGPLSARQMSMRSQCAVVRQHAERLGILADDGTLKLPARNDADIEQKRDHRAVYQALKYIENELGGKAVTKERLGSSSADYMDHLSRPTANYANTWSVDDEDEGEIISNNNHYIYLEEPKEIPNITGYSRLIPGGQFDNTGIKIGDMTLNADSVLATQLAKIGYNLESNLDDASLKEHAETLCTYRSDDGRILIVFGNLSIDSNEDHNHLDGGTIQCALIKE